jgi:hypothetical protein
MEKPKSLAWLERHSITAVLQGHLMNRLQLYEISELAKLYALHVLHRVFRMLLPHFLATLPRTKISRKSEGLLVTFRASTAFRRRYSEVKWNPKQLQNKDMWNRDQPQTLLPARPARLPDSSAQEERLYGNLYIESSNPATFANKRQVTILPYQSHSSPIKICKSAWCFRLFEPPRSQNTLRAKLITRSVSLSAQTVAPK